MSLRILYRAIYIPAGIACVGLGMKFAAQPYVMEKPGKFVTYKTKDGSMSIRHPENWKARTKAEMATLTRVEFAPARNVKFIYKSDLQGSLMADIMKSSDSQAQSLAGMVPGGTALNLPPQKSALEKIHDIEGKAMEKEDSDYPDFQEMPSKLTQLAGLQAVYSDFTFKGESASGKADMMGRRFTALAQDAHISVIYLCPKKMEKNIQKDVIKAFYEMTKSLRLGQNGGTQ